MVGSLVWVGEGRWSADDLPQALDARNRAACGPVAPPDGLYLVRVDYLMRKTLGRRDDFDLQQPGLVENPGNDHGQRRRKVAQHFCAIGFVFDVVLPVRQEATSP